MGLHQDGSTHEWVPGCQWDLIVTLDDATTEIYSAFFVEEEGTLSSFRGLREVMATKGSSVLCIVTGAPTTGTRRRRRGRVDKVWLTQVYRALQQIGITLIPAYSPEAQGRSERVFRILQDRLPKELALAGITEMTAANRYLAERFLLACNQRFAVPALKSAPPSSCGSARRSPRFSMYKTSGTWQGQHRAVSGTSLQIPQDPHQFHDVKVTVRNHEYPDGTLAVFHGPRCLARYSAEGHLLGQTRAALVRRPMPHSACGPIVDRRPNMSGRCFRNRSNFGAEKTGQIKCYIHRIS